MTIGILAIQGDFAAHQRRLSELGVETVLVRKPEELATIDGLVIPGGESGAFLKLLGENFFSSLRDFVHSKPTFGTCAGAIMLATEVTNPPQPSLSVIDMTVRRNGYGRQIDSSIRTGEWMLGQATPAAVGTNNSSTMEMVFIRAPKIERIGSAAQVIATQSGDAVAVQQGSAMAATFHPELSTDSRMHEAFLALVRGRQ